MKSSWLAVILRRCELEALGFCCLARLIRSWKMASLGRWTNLQTFVAILDSSVSDCGLGASYRSATGLEYETNAPGWSPTTLGCRRHR